MTTHDIAIIGGGPAGLSAALVLARARWKVVVYDAGVPRNVRSPAVQGFLSRDGTPPAELKAVARRQIEEYPNVTFRAERVTALEPSQLDATMVVLATGMIDVYPDLDGFAEHWGHRIIHCPYCHGFENADRPWGIMARSLAQVEAAPGYLPWTDDVMVLADPDVAIPDETRRKLEAHGIPIEQRAIRRVLTSEDGDLVGVEVADGKHVERGTLIYRPDQRQTAVVTDAGVKLNADGFVVVDEHRQTSIPGVYAGGDLTQRCQDALSAAAAGASIAKHLTGVLLERRSTR